jgi:hypothetical protein
MIVTVSRAVCDFCDRKGPTGGDDIDAARKARQALWRFIKFDVYGNEGHVCPRCADGRTDAELLAVLLKGEEESPR